MKWLIDMTSSSKPCFCIRLMCQVEHALFFNAIAADLALRYDYYLSRNIKKKVMCILSQVIVSFDL